MSEKSREGETLLNGKSSSEKVCLIYTKVN